MKLTYLFSTLAMAISLCATPVLAAQKEVKPATAPACCEKGKAEKKSTRKCCVAAERAGKACAKCTPDKQNAAKNK